MKSLPGGEITKTRLRMGVAFNVLNLCLLKTLESVATYDYLLLYEPQIFYGFVLIGGRIRVSFPCSCKFDIRCDNLMVFDCTGPGVPASRN